jgi:hypothetical protein
MKILTNLLILKMLTPQNSLHYDWLRFPIAFKHSGIHYTVHALNIFLGKLMKLWEKPGQIHIF